MPCRVNHRQKWTVRNLLEMKSNPFNYFVTLDYDDQHLPENRSVDRTTVQKWLKRFRKHLGHPIRYFAVGEYGTDRNRPHYHALIFSETEIPVEIRIRPGSLGQEYWHSKAVADTWPFGTRRDCVPIIDSDAGRKLGRYVAGYTVKKATTPKGMEYHGMPDLHPEFAVMSRRPGIGLPYCEQLGKQLREHNVKVWYARYPGIEITRDLQNVRVDGTKWPLDRSMRKAIMEAYGGDPRSAVIRLLDADKARMDRMRQSPTDRKVDDEAFHRASKRFNNQTKTRTLR